MIQVAWQNSPWVLSYQTEIEEKFHVLGDCHHEIVQEGKTYDLLISAFDIEKDKLTQAVIFPREDVRTVLIALDEQVHLENFTRTFSFVTDSLTTKNYLLHFFPHVVAVEVLECLSEETMSQLKLGKYDGIVTQACVAKRLGWTNYVVQKMNVFAFLPQIGIANLMIQAFNPKMLAILRQHFQHLPSYQALLAEINLYQNLRPQTQAAIFAFATVFQHTLTLTAGIIDSSQSLHIQAVNEGDLADAERIGIELAIRLAQNVAAGG
ncbi:MAG: hypothetical protein ACKVTZ_16855 [Bacteroidia bacterium]